MEGGYRLASPLLGATMLATMLAALPAAAREGAQALEQEALRQQQAAQMADGFAHLHGYGEGAAAVMAASLPARQQKLAATGNGKVLLKTYRQPGLELTTWSANGKTWPMSLAISRAGYPLPLGLHIGDLRGAVEDVLGAPPSDGDTLVLKRTQGEGCADPIVLTFRGKVLSQVAWTWLTCTD